MMDVVQDTEMTISIDNHGRVYYMVGTDLVIDMNIVSDDECPKIIKKLLKDDVVIDRVIIIPRDMQHELDRIFSLNELELEEMLIPNDIIVEDGPEGLDETSYNRIMSIVEQLNSNKRRNIPP